MDRAGGKLFSRAGLADQQHVAVGHRRAAHLPPNLMHGRTVTDERLRKFVRFLCRRRHQLPHAIEQRLTLTRPVKIVRGSETQRANGARLRFAQREDDDRDVRRGGGGTKTNDFRVVDEE